jgi:hypothetical protein
MIIKVSSAALFTGVIFSVVIEDLQNPLVRKAYSVCCFGQKQQKQNEIS